VTRLAFTSDLHVDHHGDVVDHITRQAMAEAVEVLLVAGDVTPLLDRARRVLAHFRQYLPRVVYVPGNHDLWTSAGSPDSRTRYEETLPELCAAVGVDYLPAGPIVLGDVTLLGQTGWYDYSLRDPALDVPLAAYERGSLGQLSWSDKHFISWPDLDDRGLTALMATRLRADLDAAPRDRPAWVVTHMLPFAELVVRRPLPWGFIGGFLGASVLGEEIVKAAAAGLEVTQVVSGHTHFRRSVTIEAGGRSFPAETSPIGYPREIALGGASLHDHVRARLRVVDV
jgi:hypothetical protein